VNEDLAKFYGMAGVTGQDFRKVPLDTSHRRGLLTQAGMVAGPLASDKGNPVTRGGFIVRKLLCQNIPLPTGDIAAMVKTPPDDPTKTTRERFTAHSSNGVCRGCHTNMDPVGFAFENYDTIGQWRSTEQNLTIDASGDSPLIGKFSGPIEFVQRMSESAVAETCLASHWVNFAYGRKLPNSGRTLARCFRFKPSSKSPATTCRSYCSPWPKATPSTIYQRCGSNGHHEFSAESTGHVARRHRRRHCSALARNHGLREDG